MKSVPDEEGIETPTTNPRKNHHFMMKSIGSRYDDEIHIGVVDQLPPVLCHERRRVFPSRRFQKFAPSRTQRVGTTIQHEIPDVRVVVGPQVGLDRFAIQAEAVRANLDLVRSISDFNVVFHGLLTGNALRHHERLPQKSTA